MENEYIYMAGFFDGEGCIRINKRIRPVSPEYSLFITIGQKDGAVIDWLLQTFGGHVHQVKRDNSFIWIVSNKKAHSVLEKITPYLKYKKPQALIALQLARSNRTKRIIPPEELARREHLYLEVKRLKQVFEPSLFAGSTTKRTDPKGM